MMEQIVIVLNFGKDSKMEELRVSIVLKERPVLVTEANGEERKFVLRELTGEERDVYLSWMSKRIKFEDGKATNITNFEGMQAELLARCLHDEENKLVPVDILQKFPASALSVLFEVAQTLNGLSIEGAKEAKND